MGSSDRMVKSERAADNVDFSREAGIVETCAAAGGFRRIEAGEGAEQSGGGGRVADAHFARAQESRHAAAWANPIAMACSASARVIAGSRVKLRVGTADAHVDDDGLDVRNGGTTR